MAVRITLALATTILLAACGAETAAPLDPDAVYFSAESSGGCAQLGPNCARFDVYGDGRVEAYRTGFDPEEPVATGAIDAALVAELHSETLDTDQAALIASLPPGECRGCYDGIDTSMSFPIPPLAGAIPTFSSVDVELVRTEPLLDLGWRVYEAAQAAVEIPLVSR